MPGQGSRRGNLVSLSVFLVGGGGVGDTVSVLPNRELQPAEYL